MTIVELIKLIKPIPELFIGIHNIFCLEAFINGWHYRDTKEDVKASILYTEFYEWLRKRYNINDSMGWANFINLKLKKRLWMSFLSYSILFYKEKYKTSLW